MKHPQKSVMPGAAIRLAATETGWLLSAEHGFYHISFHSESVIRVQFTTDSTEIQTFTYAVIKAQEKVETFFSENTDEYIFRSAHVTLVVKKKPIRFAFYNAYGNLLSEEDSKMSLLQSMQGITIHRKLQPGERFVGMGEKSGHLDKRNRAYTHWNTDCFGYGDDTDPLYASTPFFIGVHSKQLYGFFLNNPSKSQFNFGASNDRFSTVSISSGVMDYFFIHHHTMSQILDSYTALTGRSPLPPKWALGLQQCRYSYYPDKKVIEVAKGYRDRNIPADVIYLDIHYMEDYKVFTWSKKNFPQYKETLRELHKMGFKVVVILDPGIKNEAGYKPFEEGSNQRLFLQYPDGEPWSACVWPGWCHFPDFTQEQAREWWANHVKTLCDDGIDGFWCDMNEPATWGQSMPDSVEFDMDGYKDNAHAGRNVYGMQMAKATQKGAEKGHLGQRPFVLTRASFSGGQRYSAIWTGDNTSSSDHLMLGTRMVNGLGLAGFGFAGVDIGGFIGECSKELFARWISVGVFSPLCRIHTMIDTNDCEPWSYGDKIEVLARNYIQLRYRLMPYLYNAFYEHHSTGVPIQRTLALEWPHEGQVWDWRFENQFLFGGQILVAPCAPEQMFTQVWLPPAEQWFSFWDDKAYQGGEEVVVDSAIHKLPIFVRESAIIPMQPTANHTGEDVGEVLIIHLYPGSKTVSYIHYEDDGKTTDHLSGAYKKRTIIWSPSSKNLKVSAKEGSYKGGFKFFKLVFHGSQPGGIAYLNGKETSVHEERIILMEPIPQFDPLGRSDSGGIMVLPTLTFEVPDAPFEVQW